MAVAGRDDAEREDELQGGMLPLRSRDLLAQLLGELPVMAYRCLNDRSWTMEYVSEGCRLITGLAPADLLKKGRGAIAYIDLMHPDDRERVWRTIQSALHRKTAFTVLYRLLTPERVERTVLSMGHGIFTPDGELYAVEGFIVGVGGG
jgi:hypothetical protein